MQIKVLMVCLGNICRSPLAEGILKTKVDADKVFVDRIFTGDDLNRFDLIYAMDQSNYSDIISLATRDTQIQKVRLLLEEVDLGLSEVPDPYYGGDQGFEYVFDIVNRACDAVVKRIAEIEKQAYGR